MRSAEKQPDSSLKINQKILPFAKAYNLRTTEFEFRNGRVVYKDNKNFMAQTIVPPPEYVRQHPKSAKQTAFRIKPQANMSVTIHVQTDLANINQVSVNNYVGDTSKMPVRSPLLTVLNDRPKTAMLSRPQSAKVGKGPAKRIKRPQTRAIQQNNPNGYFKNAVKTMLDEDRVEQDDQDEKKRARENIELEIKQRMEVVEFLRQQEREYRERVEQVRRNDLQEKEVRLAALQELEQRNLLEAEKLCIIQQQQKEELDRLKELAIVNNERIARVEKKMVQHDIKKYREKKSVPPTDKKAHKDLAAISIQKNWRKHRAQTTFMRIKQRPKVSVDVQQSKAKLIQAAFREYRSKLVDLRSLESMHILHRHRKQEVEFATPSDDSSYRIMLIRGFYLFFSNKLVLKFYDRKTLRKLYQHSIKPRIQRVLSIEISFDRSAWEGLLGEELAPTSFEFKRILGIVMTYMTKHMKVTLEEGVYKLVHVGESSAVRKYDTVVDVARLNLKLYLKFSSENGLNYRVELINNLEMVRIKEIVKIQQWWRCAIEKKRYRAMRIRDNFRCFAVMEPFTVQVYSDSKAAVQAYYSAFIDGDLVIQVSMYPRSTLLYEIKRRLIDEGYSTQEMYTLMTLSKRKMHVYTHRVDLRKLIHYTGPIEKGFQLQEMQQLSQTIKQQVQININASHITFNSHKNYTNTLALQSKTYLYCQQYLWIHTYRLEARGTSFLQIVPKSLYDYALQNAQSLITSITKYQEWVGPIMPSSDLLDVPNQDIVELFNVFAEVTTQYPPTNKSYIQCTLLRQTEWTLIVKLLGSYNDILTRDQETTLQCKVLQNDVDLLLQSQPKLTAWEHIHLNVRINLASKTPLLFVRSCKPQQVTIIQKNVRGFLSRRRHLGEKHANAIIYRQMIEFESETLLIQVLQMTRKAPRTNFNYWVQVESLRQRKFHRLKGCMFLPDLMFDELKLKRSPLMLLKLDHQNGKVYLNLEVMREAERDDNFDFLIPAPAVIQIRTQTFEPMPALKLSIPDPMKESRQPEPDLGSQRASQDDMVYSADSQQPFNFLVSQVTESPADLASRFRYASSEPDSRATSTHLRVFQQMGGITESKQFDEAVEQQQNPTIEEQEDEQSQSQYPELAGAAISERHERRQVSIAEVQGLDEQTLLDQPVERDQALIQGDQASLEKDQARLEQDQARPVQDKAYVQQDKAPFERNQTPLQKDLVPLKQDQVTLQQDPTLVQQKQVPLEQDKAPLKQDSAPLEQEQAPLESIVANNIPDVLQQRSEQQIKEDQRIVRLLQTGAEEPLPQQNDVVANQNLEQSVQAVPIDDSLRVNEYYMHKPPHPIGTIQEVSEHRERSSSAPWSTLGQSLEQSKQQPIDKIQEVSMEAERMESPRRQQKIFDSVRSIVKEIYFKDCLYRILIELDEGRALFSDLDHRLKPTQLRISSDITNFEEYIETEVMLTLLSTPTRANKLGVIISAFVRESMRNTVHKLERLHLLYTYLMPYSVNTQYRFPQMKLKKYNLLGDLHLGWYRRVVFLRVITLNDRHEQQAQRFYSFPAERYRNMKRNFYPMIVQQLRYTDGQAITLKGDTLTKIVKDYYIEVYRESIIDTRFDQLPLTTIKGEFDFKSQKVMITHPELKIQVAIDCPCETLNVGQQMMHQIVERSHILRTRKENKLRCYNSEQISKLNKIYAWLRSEREVRAVAVIEGSRLVGVLAIVKTINHYVLYCRTLTTDGTLQTSDSCVIIGRDKRMFLRNQLSNLAPLLATWDGTQLRFTDEIQIIQ